MNRSAASLPRRAEALAAASRLRHSVAPADEIILSDDDKARFMDIIERQGKDIEELERKIDERYKHVLDAKKSASARLPTAPAFVNAAAAVTTASSAPSSKSLLFDQSVLSRY